MADPVTRPDVSTESSPVTEPEVQTAPVEETTTPIPEGQTETPAQGEAQPVPEVKQDEVDWKNRAMEYQRKLQETVEKIPDIIKETVNQSVPAKPQQPEYTVEQLEVFADSTEDVQSKLWAKAKIRELERAERENEYQRLMGAERQRITAEQTRQRVEQDVINDQRFSDAFVTLADGRKVWNDQSPLTQMASQYIQDPALKSRPDALAISMKLAYADYVLSKTGKTAEQLMGVKRENAKLKQQTLVEGAGAPGNIPKPSPIESAKQELAKTGSRTALRTLTRAILQEQGLIPKG